MIQPYRSTALVLLSLVALPFLWSLVLPGCNTTPDPMTAEQARNLVLVGMMKRGEEWDRVKKALFAPAIPKLFQEKDSLFYFVLPDSLCGPQRNHIMARYVADTSGLKWNWKRKGIMILGILRAQVSPESGCACRAKLKDLRVDTAMQISFPQSKGEYRLSFMELAEWLDNRPLYGGPVARELGSDLVLNYNYGLRVAVPGEPSLNRLTATILSGIPQGPKYREKRIQALLDFVTNEIEYDSLLLYGNEEIHRRPNEVLMMGRAGKVNQVIVLASLLEQIGEDYLLTYSKKGIFLALPRGAFPNGNGHGFTWDKQEWTFCETKMPGFRIGTDRSRGLPVYADIFQVLRPRQRGKAVNPHTGKVLTTL